MAEYIARNRIAGNVQFESAGLNPLWREAAENAVEALSMLGIDASTHVPTNISERDLASYDRIIAMDKSVGRELKGKVDASRLQVWEISDPWGDDFEEYTKCARKVIREVLRLREELVKEME